MEEKGYIAIIAREVGNDIFIHVIDNGPGFDPITLVSLWEKNDGSLKKYRENGVGLKNVHERVNIQFGGYYGIMICSSPGFGSTISIRIPKILP
ncbi:Histidine kinase-, DNA gyrase B-, and HSP90-like ATPase [compost metagenome]